MPGRYGAVIQCTAALARTLQAAFGEPAGDYRRSRFSLARQALSVFYAAFRLLEASRIGLSIDADMPTPGFREFHQGLIFDRVDMLTPEAKAHYGLIHLRAALRCALKNPWPG